MVHNCTLMNMIKMKKRIIELYFFFSLLCHICISCVHVNLREIKRQLLSSYSSENATAKNVIFALYDSIDVTDHNEMQWTWKTQTNLSIHRVSFSFLIISLRRKQVRTETILAGSMVSLKIRVKFSPRCIQRKPKLIESCLFSLNLFGVVLIKWPTNLFN